MFSRIPLVNRTDEKREKNCSRVESQFWTLHEVRTKQHGINRKHRFWMTKRKAYQRNQKEDRKLGHNTMPGEIEKNVQYCIGRTHVKYQANTSRATCSPKAEWTSCSWPLPHGGIKQHQYQTAWFICTNIWFGNSWCTSYTDMRRPCCVIFSCPDCLGRNKPTRCLRRGPFNTWSHSRPAQELFEKIRTVFAGEIAENSKRVGNGREETRPTNEPECSGAKHFCETRCFNMFLQSRTFFPCYHTSVDCGVWNGAECRVWSVKTVESCMRNLV